jgi:hypothetical protein
MLVAMHKESWFSTVNVDDERPKTKGDLVLPIVDASW